MVSISKVRFGFYLVEPVGLEDALRYGVEAEKWGFDVVAACENLFWWTPGQSSVWDNFTVLNAIMNRTKKIGFLTAVIDTVKRHPAVVAHMVSTMDNIGKGRISIGIGAGEVANYGPLLDMNPPKKPSEMLTRIREFITVTRGIWNSTLDRPFNFNGTCFHVENAYLSLKPLTKPHPPLYVAGLGPRMRKLVGEMANGWIPLTYPPEIYEKNLTEIKQYALQSGRNAEAIDGGLIAYTAVLSNGDKARKIASERGRLDVAARPALLRGMGYTRLAEQLEDQAWALREGPLTEGLSTKKETHEHAIRDIPEELATRVNVSGTPDDAIKQIEDYIKSGVRLLVLWPPYEDKDVLEETIRNYRKKILPYFKKT